MSTHVTGFQSFCIDQISHHQPKLAQILDRKGSLLVETNWKGSVISYTLFCLERSHAKVTIKEVSNKKCS